MCSLRTARAAVVVLGLALVSACGGASSTSGVASVPTFTAQTLAGGELSSASFAGHDTVLWFWAPWCTVCRGEAPDVLAAANQFQGRVQLIGVAGRGQVPEMNGFVSDTDMGGFTHLVDSDGSIWSAFGVYQQPAFAFIDSRGHVEVVDERLDEAQIVDRLNALVAT